MQTRTAVGAAKTYQQLTRGSICVIALSLADGTASSTESVINYQCTSASGIPSAFVERGAPCLTLAPCAYPVQPYINLSSNYLHPLSPTSTILLVLTSVSHTKPVVMATRTRRGKTSILNDRIDILNRNVAETSPAKEIYRIVIIILTLVRVSPLFLHPSIGPH